MRGHGCILAASITEERVRVSATFAAKSLDYEKLKDLQMEVILSLVMGKDVFAILSTGYGKSLCYASLPLCINPQRNCCDTIDSYNGRPGKSNEAKLLHKLNVHYLGNEQRAFSGCIEQQCHPATVQFVCCFFTPELRKWRDLFHSKPYMSRVRAFVVDEAHTVKKWYVSYILLCTYINHELNRGETFREALLSVGEVRSLLPQGVHMMALTATATKTLQRKVAKILGMHLPKVIPVSPCKSNLMYSVVTHTSIRRTFMPLLKRLREDGSSMPRIIIYCRRIETCGDLCDFFKD